MPRVIACEIEHATVVAYACANHDLSAIVCEFHSTAKEVVGGITNQRQRVGVQGPHGAVGISSVQQNGAGQANGALVANSELVGGQSGGLECHGARQNVDAVVRSVVAQMHGKGVTPNAKKIAIAREYYCDARYLTSRFKEVGINLRPRHRRERFWP